MFCLLLFNAAYARYSCASFEVSHACVLFGPISRRWQCWQIISGQLRQCCCSNCCCCCCWALRQLLHWSTAVFFLALYKVGGARWSVQKVVTRTHRHTRTHTDTRTHIQLVSTTRTWCCCCSSFFVVVVVVICCIIETERFPRSTKLLLLLLLPHCTCVRVCVNVCVCLAVINWRPCDLGQGQSRVWLG